MKTLETNPGNSNHYDFSVQLNAQSTAASNQSAQKQTAPNQHPEILSIKTITAFAIISNQGQAMDEALIL